MKKKEVEVKIRLAGPVSAVRERLRRLGAECTKPRFFENNVILDTPDESLKRQGNLLRVRTVGQGGLLTFKAAEEAPARHKTRLEIESAVDDPASVVDVLKRLGFGTAFRYQKYRESYRLGSCHVEIDETPVGNYLEIEGPPDQIDTQASLLGYAERDYILLTYAELFEQECRRTGRDPSPGMVFDPDPAGAP